MSNILLFSRCMGSGGTEKIILQLANAYRSAGHRVYVLAEDGPAAKKLPELGVELFPIPDMESKSLKVVSEIMSTLRRILVEKDIDVVHTHHRMAAFYARLLRPFHKFVFLNDIHYQFSDKRLLTRFAMGKAVNIAVGEAVRKNLTENYGLTGVRVIYNAVETPKRPDQEDPAMARLHEQGRFVVVNIGRVAPGKGFASFVRAAALLKDKPISFVIVGDGAEMGQTRALAKELDAPVTFLGYRLDVAELIFQSDLAVLSSESEGLPMVPLEVFSAGKTIVATAVPGTMDVVLDGENGMLVPVGEPEAIAKAVRRLYDDRELLHTLEAGARKTFAEQFSIQVFRQKYLALLEEVTK